jgi:hypothetical protein
MDFLYLQFLTGQLMHPVVLVARDLPLMLQCHVHPLVVELELTIEPVLKFGHNQIYQYHVSLWNLGFKKH